MTTQKAVIMPTEKTSGDKAFDAPKTKQSPGRGTREDGSGSNTPKSR